MTTETTERPIRWEIFNKQTGRTTSYKSGRAASNAQERMDRAYGACCTTRKAIWA